LAGAQFALRFEVGSDYALDHPVTLEPDKAKRGSWTRRSIHVF
jgi:hypothetical protein